jgi:hypothetical protein
MTTKQEIELMVEALAMAASRHESMGHVTQGRFRYQHTRRRDACASCDLASRSSSATSRERRGG